MPYFGNCISLRPTSILRHPECERAPSSCREDSHEEGIDEGRLDRFYFLAPGRADCSGPLAYEGPKGHDISMPIARTGANCLFKCDRWFAQRLPCTVLPGILI